MRIDLKLLIKLYWKRDGARDLIQAYKIITGKDNVNCEQFFTFRENADTRGNSMKVYKPRLKKSILQRVYF